MHKVFGFEMHKIRELKNGARSSEMNDKLSKMWAGEKNANDLESN